MRAILNTSLLLLSLLFSYLAAEWLFLHHYTTFFSMGSIGQRFENPKGIYPLMQNSKRSFYPKNYIAVTGDSYAMGLGDGMLETASEPKPRNHSTHTIQDLTGRDVVSYGLPGSGSVRGMITNPISQEKYIRTLVSKSYPAPEWVLIYFYEGNDFTENWIYYQKTFEEISYSPKLNYNKQEDFDIYIEKTALGRDHLFLSAEKGRLQDRLFLYRYIYRLYIQNIKKRKFFSRKFKNELRLEYEPDYKWVNRFSDNPVNQAILNGQKKPMADNMQGPSMDLTDTQLKHAADTFSKSLNYARRYYSQSKLAVIYIPSPLSIYQPAGAKVHAQNFFTEQQIFSKNSLDKRAAWIKHQVMLRTKEQQVIFIDTSKELKQAGSKQFLHGPKDWNHLNLAGYRVLGESIVKHMTTHWNSDD